MNDIPCKCGHSEEPHLRTLGPNPNSRCYIFACDCEGYVADNLSFIERKANERGL